MTVDIGGAIYPVVAVVVRVAGEGVVPRTSIWRK